MEIALMQQPSHIYITSPILKGLVPILQHFPFLMNLTPVGTTTA